MWCFIEYDIYRGEHTTSIKTELLNKLLRIFPGTGVIYSMLSMDAEISTHIFLYYKKYDDFL
jgi:hypothetical protein